MLYSLYTKIMGRLNTLIAESPIGERVFPNNMGTLAIEGIDPCIHYEGVSIDGNARISIRHYPKGGHSGKYAHTSSLALNIVMLDTGDSTGIMLIDSAGTVGPECITDTVYLDALSKAENLAKFIELEKLIYSSIFAEQVKPSEMDDIIT